MAEKSLNLIVLLENNLANFYSKIKNLPRLTGAKEVLEFMEVHSFEHANIIEQLKINLPKPTLNENAINNYQNNLTKSLFDRIMHEENILSLLQQLADSEESVGKLYMGVSGVFIKLSDYYRSVAAQIETIAKDEYNHRDLLLKDKARLAQRFEKEKR
jgi:hypothetical protein